MRFTLKDDDSTSVQKFGSFSISHWKSKHHVWLVYVQTEAFMSLTEAALFVWGAEGSEI